MIETWRNLLRRPLRTSLTVLGILVGTLALTVMGAMSEKINLLVDGALDFYGTRIIVQAQANFPGQFIGVPLFIRTADEIKDLPGVDEVFPIVYLLYQEEQGETPSIGFGFPPLVAGVDARRFTYEKDRYPIVLSQGSFFRTEDRGVAIVGVDLAQLQDVSLGDSLKMSGRKLRVVGVMERTLTVRDNMAFIPLAEAQEILAASLPPPLNEAPHALVSEIEVHPADLTQADAVAQAINERVSGVRALAPGELARQFRQSLVIFNVILVGSAVIAVVVGGLAILNTMFMAVSERTREIGIKKAVGATNGDIIREFLREAAAIGLLGGLLGLAVGALLVFAINRVTAMQGVVIFAVTPRLSVLVVLFTVLLGVGAGLLPALAAARRNPVEALRAE